MTDPIAAASATLPVLVHWGSLLYVIVAFVGARFIAGVGIWLAMPRAPERAAPWYERARVAYPARRVFRLSLIFLPIAFAFAATFMHSPFSAVPARVLVLAATVAALVGVEQAGMRMERAIGLQVPSLAARLGGALSGIVALGFHALVAVLGILLAWPWFRSWAAVAALVPVLAFGALGGGLYVARVLRLARPAGPRLATAVQRASVAAKIAAPATYELSWQIANAFAFPVLRAVAFTRGALAVLSDDEIEAVASHELAHLAEPFAMRWLRPAIGLIVSAAIASIPAAMDLGSSAVWALAVAAFGLALFVRKAARPMEKRADSSATAEHATAYAAGLAKIYEANLAPAVMSRAALHPCLYDRLAAAGARPTYPRPLPPQQAKTFAGLALVCGGFILISCVLQMVPRLGGWLPLSVQPDEACLGNYALARFRAGDIDGSATLYRACTTLYGGLYCPANLAIVEARAGRCKNAWDAARQAGARLKDATDDAERALFFSATRAAGSCVPSMPAAGWSGTRAEHPY